MFRRLATAMVFMLGLIVTAAQAEPVALVFTAAADLDLKITYREKPGGRLNTLLHETVDGENIWIYETPEPPAEWIAKPIFTITFPPRDVTELSLDKMSITLAFELRAMLEDEEIRIPIIPVSSVSEAEFGEIETMAANDRYAKIVMMKQFAAHYIFNAGDGRTRFTARLARAWFAAQWGGIMKPQTPEERLALVLDSDLIKALTLALPRTDLAWKDLDTRIREWQAAFWNIPNGDFQTVIRRRACDYGNLALGYVATRNEEDGPAQGFSGVNGTEQIAEMERKVKLCQETRMAAGT